MKTDYKKHNCNNRIIYNNIQAKTKNLSKRIKDCILYSQIFW